VEPKKTALYDIHRRHGGKIIDFAGYMMPVQYRGIMDEHRRVRETVGIFDVSHMGEFEISGPNAAAFIQMMTTNNVNKLATKQVQYSAMCYDDGGIVDDLLVYRYPDKFMMVVNASNLEKDFSWLQQHLMEGVELKNRSDEFSLLALQGRNAVDVLRKLTPIDPDAIDTYWFTQAKLSGVDMMIARTGYTGEDGFELMFDQKHSAGIWESIMEAGEAFDIEPIGLGARDTLRLEVGYCLYGNDIDKDTHPLEAGLGWITKLKKGDFIGRDAILEAKDKGLKRKLVGFRYDERSFPRKGYGIYSREEKIGVVTSGTFSPMLGVSIGMGYVDKAYTDVDTDIDIDIRGKRKRARVTKLPFYDRPY
jgi:aminomethyltransferase